MLSTLPAHPQAVMIGSSRQIWIVDRNLTDRTVAHCLVVPGQRNCPALVVQEGSTPCHVPLRGIDMILPVERSNHCKPGCARQGPGLGSMFFVVAVLSRSSTVLRSFGSGS